MYGYNPKKISEKKENNYVNIKKLTKLLEDSDVEHLSNLSTELSGGGDETEPEDEEKGKNGVSNEESKTTQETTTQETTTPASTDSDKEGQAGGAKKYNDKVKKLNRKHFFDDSDLDSSSTESLSSMDLSDSDS